MLREQARPVNDADAAIRQAINQRETAPLDQIRGDVPPQLTDFLDKLLAADGDVANWMQLADSLCAAGLTAAALAAYGRAAVNARFATSGRTLAQRAEAYSIKAALERTLNMTWAAAADERIASRLRGVPNSDGLPLELEEDELAVQTAFRDPADYARIVASLTDSPLIDDPLRDPFLTKRVAQATPIPGEGIAVDDCSFLVLDGDGRPILQVEADVRGDRYLACHESAIVLTRLVEAHPLMPQAENLAVRQLRIMLDWCGSTSAMFEIRPTDPFPPMLRQWITVSKRGPLPFTAAWIDLSASEEEIERGYRDAHRQSLRWGRRNIRITKTISPDPAMLDLYERVHRESRRMPGLPAADLARYLGEGRFNLYIAYFEEEPVVALLSSRHGSTTYYWASAKKIIGNKPLGHVVLHQAIVDAKAEGQKRFDFGRLHVSENFDSKLRNIALYKRGFASHTEPCVLYTVLAEPASR